jgi:hypothetical protein
MTVSTATLERQSTFTLKSVEGDILTFAQDKHADLKVRMLPQKLADGKLVLFEPWQKDQTGKLSRLRTERGYEWVFEPPLLMQYHLSQDGYPTNANELIGRFFEIMHDAEFKNYPREIFR